MAVHVIQHRYDLAPTGVDDNMEGVTPVCSCGWKGVSVPACNGDMYAQIVRQTNRHILAAERDAQPTPSAPVGDGWQPIETAPKDGTWVLIARPEWDQAVVAKWDEYGYVEGSAGEVLMFGWIFRDTGLLMGGMECGFLGWEEDADSMPTHWTVAPPAARAAQANGSPDHFADVNKMVGGAA